MKACQQFCRKIQARGGRVQRDSQLSIAEEKCCFALEGSASSRGEKVEAQSRRAARREQEEVEKKWTRRKAKQKSSMTKGREKGMN